MGSLDDIKKIQQSAVQLEHPEHMVGQLLQLLGYRQRVAQELLNHNGIEKYQEGREVYDYTNNQIKKLLNL